ncbi:hypothetical protein L914_12108, partial [Phytophthora nicotianae]
MGKNNGSSNYKMAEVNRLMDLVESYLPLGKDGWERLASEFNATRPPYIPPHIERAKELKRVMDEKANVVEMDACADVGSDEGPDEKDDEEEERRVESDFSFDYEPDGSLFPDRGGDGDGDAVAGG